MGKEYGNLRILPYPPLESVDHDAVEQNGIGCDLFDKRAIERIYQLKRLPKDHGLSFICQDLAEVSQYAMVDNAAYRVLRRKVPGPYTFILPATRVVPDLMLRRQKTVGIRVPNDPIALEIVRKLGHPIVSTSAATPEGETLIEARDHPERYPNLLVRVSGYSAYFRDLNDAMKDEIITRTAYDLATGRAVPFPAGQQDMLPSNLP